MEYKFKPVNIDLKSPKDKIEFPDYKDRVIEKRGHVVEFTMQQIEDNTKLLLRNKKEIEAKRNFEAAKMKNIEAFHSWVKRMSEERLHHAWLYYEAKSIVKLCNEKLEEINLQISDDEKEVAEIKKQIPELAVAPITEEVVQMIKDEQNGKDKK